MSNILTVIRETFKAKTLTREAYTKFMFPFLIVSILVIYLSMFVSVSLYLFLCLGLILVLAFINVKRVRDSGRSTDVMWVYLIIPVFFIAHTLILLFSDYKKTIPETKVLSK